MESVKEKHCADEQEIHPSAPRAAPNTIRMLLPELFHQKDENDVHAEHAELSDDPKPQVEWHQEQCAELETVEYGWSYPVYSKRIEYSFFPRIIEINDGTEREERDAEPEDAEYLQNMCQDQNDSFFLAGQTIIHYFSSEIIA